MRLFANDDPGLPEPSSPEPFDDFEQAERDDQPPDGMRWDWRDMDWLLVSTPRNCRKY